MNITIYSKTLEGKTFAVSRFFPYSQNLSQIMILLIDDISLYKHATMKAFP